MRAIDVICIVNQPSSHKPALRRLRNKIGVHTAKDALYAKLKVTASGPGYCHFPDSYQQEYFNQLTSE
jgi:phage terminase large subunit GpA-like protein